MTVPVGRAGLAAVRAGTAGMPQVVFLHANIADSRSWSELLDLLATDVDAAAYDRRGFGRTKYETEAHDQLVDLLAVQNACGFVRPALVGNSRGGQIALDCAVVHPERVGALILLAPGVSGAPQVLESDLRADEAAFWTGLEEAEATGDLEALNEGEIRLWLDGLQAPHGRVDGDRRRLALDMNAVALAAASPGQEPKAIDTWDRLDEIACPVLIVVGDLDMSHMQARARELTGRIAGARLVVMEGAAHLPALEQPDAVATMTREFLSSLG